MHLCRDSGAQFSALLRSMEVMIMRAKHLTDDVLSKYDSVLISGAGRAELLFIPDPTCLELTQLSLHYSALPS